jgi:hypothetical protein
VLAPEIIRPPDGAHNQDCGIKAAKRWLPGHNAHDSQPQASVLGEANGAFMPKRFDPPSQPKTN